MSSGSAPAVPKAPAPHPEPTAIAEPEPVVAAAIPLTWEGDDQLAAAILGSMAVEFGPAPSAVPELHGRLSGTGF